MANLAWEILVAASATKLENMIREQLRELGTMLKARGVDVKEAQKMALDAYAEGIETLKRASQQESEKKH